MGRIGSDELLSAFDRLRLLLVDAVFVDNFSVVVRPPSISIDEVKDLFAPDDLLLWEFTFPSKSIAYRFQLVRDV